MNRWALATAALLVTGPASGEETKNAVTLLDSDVIEISVGDSIRRQEVLHAASQLDRFPCSKQELAALEKVLSDPGFTLSQMLRRARAMNGGPIRVRVSDKPKFTGLLRRTRTLGEFDDDTGAINLYCHEEKAGHVTMSGSGDQAETLSHELGHMVMYHAYKKALPEHDGHSGKFSLSSAGGAWNEGFATFFALGLKAENTRGSCIYRRHCLDDVVLQLQDKGADRQKWRDRPWVEKIRNEDFVFAFLGELAAAPAQDGKLPIDLAKMDRLLGPLELAQKEAPGGLHQDFDAYLRHYLKLNPGEKDRVKEEARRLMGDAPLPAFLK